MKSSKSTWVKFREIKERTEWDTYRKIERARNLGYVDFDRRTKMYDLNSVAETFLKTRTA